MRIQIALDVTSHSFFSSQDEYALSYAIFFYYEKTNKFHLNNEQHYYLHDDKSGNEALFQGFRWLKQHSANTGGLIAVPALRNLERYASLQRFEGLKALIRPPNRAIIEGIVYELILPSKMLRHGINRPLLILHPAKEFFEKVLHIRDLSAMFVISYDKPN
jgi:hypothetical protein